MTGAEAVAASHRTLAQNSKSFALATRLLGRRDADRAAVIYAWCRRADDAVDLCAPVDAPAAVGRLRTELHGLAEPEPVVAADPVLTAFGQVMRDVHIPVAYPRALLDGMAADATNRRYETLSDLYAYGYEVAGTVGLMMSHVFGVRDERALRQAVHLGIAMQLTNICRDVAEDWERGRLYLPDELCADVGMSGLRARLGEPVAALPRAPVAAAVKQLLAMATRFYRSGEQGISALPWRAGFAVRAASAIYASIGHRLARRGFDPLAGRVVVPTTHKLALVLAALGGQLLRGPAALVARAARTPTTLLRFPADVLPL